MTEAQGPFFQEGSTGKPTGATAVTAFAYTNKTVFDDIIRRLQNQHRSWLWYKGLNADLLDSLHAAYLTTAVNEDDVDHPDLNDTLPAAPSGGLNVKWQVQATQNSDSQTPVSAYVPFSSLSIVTAVAADYVVITDTSDFANPKRALVSDITALVAPADAQYLTLATNATLTNERVLTEGLGIDFADAGAGSTLTVTLDLGEISTGTPSGADTFVFVDADDQTGKRGTAADTLVALGAAPSTTAVTAASALADNEVPKIDGASRAVQASGLYLNDVVFGLLVQRTADISSASASDALSLRSGDNAGAGNTGDIALRSGTAGTGTSGDAILDAGPGTAANGTAKVGATNADAVSIGRSGKNTQVNGTLGVTGAVTVASTISSIVMDILTADETEDQTVITNSGLNITLEAGKYYAFEAWLPMSAVSGAVLDLDGGTATMTAMAYEARMVTTTGTAGEDVLAVNNTALATDITAATAALDSVTLRGYLQVNAGCTFIIRFASDTADTITTLKKGAWVRCMRVG